jgi:uncharacterized Fe-S cluster-containing radical SAM superfamily enzyme
MAMAEQSTLSFETLAFEQQEGKVNVSFMKLFYFLVDDSELEAIGKFEVKGNTITFDVPEAKASKKFNFLLEKGFKKLVNKISRKPAVYVHKNSGIPLIGNISFGLVDRDCSIIEVKPITSCNLKCIFCSVDESKRQTDYIVDREYLVEEFKKLVEHKGIEGIEAHIAAQGEPLLYSEIVELVQDLRKIKQVGTISIDTNGTLLDKKKVDDLVEAGLSRFNFSINAFTEEKACEMAGAPYNLKHILEMADYISKSKKVNMIITPIWVPGFNDEDIEKLVGFVKEKGLEIGIQNFLNYRFGKNPVKQRSWEEFYEKLKGLEKKYGVKLILNMKEEFKIRETEPLPKPFRKGEKVKAAIICSGRLEGECIAVAEGRTISVPNCSASGKVMLKITRSKHNIYYGVIA